MPDACLTLLDTFAVVPAADDGFIADWERARELLRAGGACREMVLHRALRRDLDPRFVSLARVLSRPALEAVITDPAYPGLATTLYEVVREHGTPDIEGGVVLVDPIASPAGGDERFLAEWQRSRAVLGEQQGYLGTRLYRHVGPSGLRFVDVARWSSPLMFARALRRPEFRQGTRCSQAALYQPVRG
jgi:heme-degrading monooxygenase HmoA